MRTPEPIAHQHDRRRALSRVVLLEQPPESRAHTQRLQRVGRGTGTVDAYRLAAAKERGREPAEPCQRFERALPRAQVDEIAKRDVGLGETGLDVAVPEHDELVGAVVGQRSEQNRFDHGKECGIGADAEGQREDGSRREGRLPPEDPQRLTDVVGSHGPVRREKSAGC